MATKKKTRKQKKPGTDEISAAASHDLYEHFMADIITNPDQVVAKESKGEGLKIYEQIEDKDGHVASVIQTRKLAVIGKEWGVEPASDKREDVKRAEFVEKVFKEMPFDEARKGALDSIMKGFAVLEEIWELSAGQFWIREFKHRKPWRFVFGKENELRMLTESDSLKGVEVPREKFWLHTFESRYGNPYGRGLGRQVFWPWLFKRNNLKWWAIFNEKFGGPTGIGKYPPATEKKKQNELLDVIKSIQNETAIVIPDDMSVELMEATRRGSFETYSKFINWCEDQQSKIVLGQTLTTQQGDKGARSLGEVHDRVREDILKADADRLSESLNEGPVKQLVDFNFGPTQKYPKFWIRTEKEKDLKPLAERDKLIFEMGYRPTQEYIEDTFSIDVEPVQPPKPPPPDVPNAQILPPEFAQDDEDALAGFVERITRDARMDPFIAQITKTFEQSKSLEEFRQGLVNEFSGQSTARLADLIENGLLAAELTGRFKSLPKEKQE